MKFIVLFSILLVFSSATIFPIGIDCEEGDCPSTFHCERTPDCVSCQPDFLPNQVGLIKNTEHGTELQTSNFIKLVEFEEEFEDNSLVFFYFFTDSSIRKDEEAKKNIKKTCEYVLVQDVNKDFSIKSLGMDCSESVVQDSLQISDMSFFQKLDFWFKSYWRIFTSFFQF